MGLMQSGRGNDHTPQCSAMVDYAWRCASAPLRNGTVFFYLLLEKQKPIKIEINRAKLFVAIGPTIFALTGFPHAYEITSICTNLDDRHAVYC